MASLIGRRLGQYEILAELGRGGMAAVYRARQLSMKRDVAIKVIRPEHLTTANFMKRFDREAETIAGLSHAHILKVFDYGHEEDITYLVMELLTGGSLADRIPKDGSLPVEFVVSVLGEIADALDYAHSKGIVHRDLKPQNVLFDEGHHAFLTDFGIAKLLSGDAGLTGTGVAIGTPSYMSPEQWQGHAVDSRADLYALGIMLFEMLSGQIPFQSDTPVGMMHQHVYVPPPPLSVKRPDLPPAVDTVISKALAKLPAERFANGRAMLNAFKAALRGEAVPAGEMPTMVDTTAPKIQLPVPAPAPKPASRAPILITGAVIIALVAVIGILLVTRNSSSVQNATSTPPSVVIANQTLTPESSPTIAATSTAVPTSTATIAPTVTLPNTVMPTATPTVTATLTETPTATVTPSPSLTVTPSPTANLPGTAIAALTQTAEARAQMPQETPDLLGTARVALTQTAEARQNPPTPSLLGTAIAALTSTAEAQAKAPKTTPDLLGTAMAALTQTRQSAAATPALLGTAIAYLTATAQHAFIGTLKASVALRNSPSETGALIQILPQNEQVTVLGRSEDSQWCKVRYRFDTSQSVEGWIFHEALTITRNQQDVSLSELPIVR